MKEYFKNENDLNGTFSNLNKFRNEIWRIFGIFNENIITKRE